MDPGNRDFHLRAGSPAIDTASDVGAPAKDFDSLARPVDGDGEGVAFQDIGAYEFYSSTGGVFFPLVFEVLSGQTISS